MPVAVADVVAVCVSRGDKLGGLFELCRYTERRGEVVGRAHRQIAYRNRHPALISPFIVSLSVPSPPQQITRSCFRAKSRAMFMASP